MLRSLVEHSFKSAIHYRMTALYLIVGIALTTARVPITNNSSPSSAEDFQRSIPNPEVLHRPMLTNLRLEFGQPPILFFNIACHVVAAWLSFLGIFWDVRRRTKEWALIRLCGRHPSLIAGFQYFCLSLFGVLMGGTFVIRIGFSAPAVFEQMSAIAVWGIVFSFCVSLGPIIYTEFFDIIPVIRIEGEIP